MIFTNRVNMSPVQEAYYGKLKEFLIIEKELDKIISAIHANSVLTKDKIRLDRKVTTIASSDSVALIEQMFKKVFSLKEFYLNFYTSMPLGAFLRPNFNAFTFCNGFAYFKKKKSPKRVDSTDMVIGVNVDMGLVRGASLTADELMAIILHEIGHNMSASLFSLLSNVSLAALLSLRGAATYIGALVISAKIMPYVSTVNKDIESVIEKNPRLHSMFTMLSEINLNTLFVQKGLGIATSVLALIKKFSSPLALAINLFQPSNLFKFTEEKYADSFATAYGYGPALARAMSKLQSTPGIQTETVIKNMPVINWATDFINISFRIITSPFRIHPQDPARIHSQLKKLKRDLNDPTIDSRVRKDILEDIAEMEDFIDNHYLDFNKNDNKKQVFKWLYNRAVIKIFDGNVDFRETLNIFDIEE